MNNTGFKQFLAPCCKIAKEAGSIILDHDPYNIEVLIKPDDSPVTIADTKANEHITQSLAQLTPDIPIIAEEDKEHLQNPPAVFWLVDPLDGTRSFTAGEGEYTVNIALIENGLPVLGVIYLPPLDTLYYGTEEQGAWRVKNGQEEAIKVRGTSPDELTVVRSKSHASPKSSSFLQQYRYKTINQVSSSIKFCHVAEGSADVYPRLGTTMEWDTAAGHAILNAAGGGVETIDGKPFIYGKHGYKNPHFIAYGVPYRECKK